MTENKRKFQLLLKPAIACILLAVALFCCQAQALYRWLPDSMGVVSQLLNSFSYWLIIPGRLISKVVFPPVDHHYPIGNYILGCALTAIFYTFSYSVYLLWRKSKWAHFVTPSSTSAKWQKATIMSLLAIGTGFFLYVSIIEPNRLVIREYTVEINNLPDQWDGLKVVQLSDTHYGPFINPNHLNRAIKVTNELHPDLVLLTGDYTHKTPASIRPGIELFKDLQPTYGTIAILGNHEHWEGAAECLKVFEEINIPVIDNDHLFLSTENGLTSNTSSSNNLCIAGVGDYWEDICDLDIALHGVPQSTPRLLLSHNPDFAENIEPRHRIDLMLAGHTHGGQAYVPGFPRLAPTNYGEKYIGGYTEGPHCPVIISRGLGMSVLPLRFLVPPEIVMITLRSAD